MERNFGCGVMMGLVGVEFARLGRVLRGEGRGRRMRDRVMAWNRIFGGCESGKIARGLMFEEFDVFMMRWGSNRGMRKNQEVKERWAV